MDGLQRRRGAASPRTILGRFSLRQPISPGTMFTLPPSFFEPTLPAPTDDIPAPADKPKKKRKRAAIKHLTEDELGRLFAMIDSVRDRAIFQLAYRAGLRASEVGLLEMRDYDAKADKIFVHRLKGSNSGEHHLVREEARVLRAWLKVRGPLPGPIFQSQRKQPISRRRLDALMKKYGAAAGIPPPLRHFHVLKNASPHYTTFQKVFILN